MNILSFKKQVIFLGVLCALMLFSVSYSLVSAATLRLSPDTGVYTAGGTFSVRIVVNTQGQPINAAEGEVAFDPDDLSVVSVSKAGSIFTLWTREPEFSNTAGKIYFGGGSPSGYTGSAGTVMTVTFRAKHAGTTNVTYAVGSILAADGKGTNVLSGMQSGSYTIGVVTEAPEPEYIAPPNTPAAPVVTSSTHPDQQKWYTLKDAELSWKLPTGVTALRTLLDTKSGTIPTKVYENPVSSLKLENLDEGVSYFHIQYKNADGWGRVTHYKLSVDSIKPESLTITPTAENDAAHPEQVLDLAVVDSGSGALYYMIQIDGGERTRFDDKEKTHVYRTPALSPGAHTILVEAFDGAGNSVVNSYSFTVEAFDAPVFTEYPTEVSSAVIPVIRGTTRKDAQVTVTVMRTGEVPRSFETQADVNGVFTFIPEARFAEGVYEISAVAKDTSGGISLTSDTIRIAVQQPGLVRLGGMAISLLSVLVPLCALLFLSVFGVLYGWRHAQVFRRSVTKEITEAEQSLAREFHGIVSLVQENVEELKKSRKGKLTKQEEELISNIAEGLESAESRIRKEMEDVEKLAK